MIKKYELIVEDIEKLIHLNVIKQGERLPSIRSLSIKYGCNKSTVIRAYKELEAKHKVYVIPKGGFYVVEKNSSISSEIPIIDFSQAMPDPKLLPYKEFNHCINKAIEIYKSSLFSYSDSQGLESLRKILVKDFSEHQIFTSAEKIYITSGAQQALTILSKMPFPNGKKNILVEQPTYSLIHGIVELNGCNLIGISRDCNGIDLNELESIFMKGDIKFFYTIPRFHNPLGTSYSEGMKQKIVDLAEKYDVYIVEDDYLADIETNKKVLPLYYYDLSEKVIYVKSFSKAFMPGIRVGAVVLHSKLKSEFFKHKRSMDLNTSVLSQGALEIFINSGMYSKHIKKTQSKYKAKMEYLRRALKDANTNGVEILTPEMGFYAWVKFTETFNVKALLETLKRKNVYLAPSEEFYIRDNVKENGFRVCISKLSDEQIRSGIEIIFNEIQNMRKITWRSSKN